MPVRKLSSRREFLRLSALAASGAAILAACGPTAPPTAEPKTAAEATKPAAPTAAAPTKPTEPAKAAETAKPTVAAAKPAPAGTTEIRLHVRTGTEADTLADLIPPFEKEQNVKVKIESFPTNEYYQKLQILLAGGQAGDVWWGVVYTGQGLYHAANGIMLFLDDLVKADKFDLDQYYPAAIEGCRYKGQLFGLPFKLHPGAVALYYNVNLVKAAGIPEPKPKTHEELVDIAKALTKREGSKTTQWGYVHGFGSVPHFYIQWTRAWGGDILSKDGTKALVNTEPSMAGIRFAHDIIYKHKVAPEMSQIANNDVGQLFISGVVGTMQGYSSDKSLPSRIKDRFQVMNTMMPKGPTGKYGLWMVTDFVGINAKTKYQQQSWELTKLLGGKELGIRLGEGTGGASGTSGGRKDVFESERLKKNPLHQMFIEAVSINEEGSEMRIPANFRGDEFNKALGQKMGPLWLGEAQPTKEFFDGVNKTLQDILDKPAP